MPTGMQLPPQQEYSARPVKSQEPRTTAGPKNVAEARAQQTASMRGGPLSGLTDSQRAAVRELIDQGMTRTEAIAQVLGQTQGGDTSGGNQGGDTSGGNQSGDTSGGNQSGVSILDDPAANIQMPEAPQIEDVELVRYETLDRPEYTDIGPAAQASTDISIEAPTTQATTAQAAGDVSAPTAVQAQQMEAVTVADQTRGVEAAQGEVSEQALAQVEEGAITAPAVAAERDAAAEQAARAMAATRPEARDYAVAATQGVAAEIEDIEGPAVITREGATISEAEVQRLGQIAQGRGVDLQDLPEYKDVIQKRIAQQGEAATAEYRSRLGETPQAEAAQAEFVGADETPQAQQQRIEQFESFSPAKREAYTTLGVDAPEAAQMEEVRQAAAASREAITADSSPEMIAEQTDLDKLGTYQMAAKRTAQVAEAAEGIATQLGGQPAVDFEGREAILGEAPAGDAAQIGGIPTAQAAQMQAVTGQARKMAAADMATVVVEMPPEVTAAISEDPATVEAQLDTGEDPQVVAAVAALPEEALVSTQMEGLLAGMEDGEVPMWARPAVDAINAQMAQRGLSTSTVGRDALFNAIIQSALPMAQSNAQALQQRASQNLNNQQQANLEQSKQIASLRMQNLANRQTAASQTAQMAQQIKMQQGEFRQQAQILTAQQEQQARMTDVQFQQQRAQQESAQRQQAAVQNLSASQQMELANLTSHQCFCYSKLDSRTTNTSYVLSSSSQSYYASG